MRGDGRKREDGDDEGDDRGRKRERFREQRGFGWSKKYVPVSKSGRVIKGRGNFVSFKQCEKSGDCFN